MFIEFWKHELLVCVLMSIGLYNEAQERGFQSATVHTVFRNDEKRNQLTHFAKTLKSKVIIQILKCSFWFFL